LPEYIQKTGEQAFEFIATQALQVAVGFPMKTGQLAAVREE
jgi:hypothetical protein